MAQLLDIVGDEKNYMKLQEEHANEVVDLIISYLKIAFEPWSTYDQPPSKCDCMRIHHGPSAINKGLAKALRHNLKKREPQLLFMLRNLPRD